jgi:hypothetical protein
MRGMVTDGMRQTLLLPILIVADVYNDTSQANHGKIFMFLL